MAKRKTPAKKPTPDAALAHIVEALRPLAVELSSIKPDPRNARRHDAANLAAIKSSLKRFGQRQPLVVNRQTGLILAGNARYLVAEQLGWTHVAVVYVEDDATSACGFALADNRTAELATWDDALLAEILAEIRTSQQDQETDLVAELQWEHLLAEVETVGAQTETEVTVELSRADELLKKWKVKPGDLWSIEGKQSHRILCGDSRREEDRKRLLGDDPPEVCIADPPYGVSHNTDYRRFSGGKRGPKARGTNYGPMIAGDDEPFDPSPFLKFKHVVLWGFNCFSDRLPCGSLLIWCKRRDSQLGSFMSDCEVAWFNRGHGCYLFSHVWNGHDRESERGIHLHPTQKPVALASWVIERTNSKGGIYDPYLGTAPTMLAAERASRSCFGMELEPKYVAVAVALERMTLAGCKCKRVEGD